MPDSIRSKRFKKRKLSKSKRSFNFVLPKSSLLFFSMAFIFMLMSNLENSESSPNVAYLQSDSRNTTKGLLTVSNISDSIMSITSPNRNTLNNFLARQDESACSAVYDPSMVQKAIARIPQIADRIKGMSKAEQYKACVEKVRSAKSSLSKHL